MAAVTRGGVLWRAALRKTVNLLVVGSNPSAGVHIGGCFRVSLSALSIFRKKGKNQ